MVILIRCNDIVTDPRAMKYVRFLQEKGIEHRLIGWDRDGVRPQLENAVFWERKAGYNVGGMKAARHRFGWMLFVLQTLRQFKADGLVLHGCDVDSAFPGAVFKLFHKNAKLIFDVFDWFSATLYNQNSLILFAFKFLERFTVKHSDTIIICEPERIEQIPYKIDSSMVTVLPNIPFFSDSSFVKEDSGKSFSNGLITISYVGGFCKERCLFEIVELAEKGVINLAIAGFGDKELEEKLDSLKGCPYIKYYGKVSYQDGLNISYNSDVMYAMYSKVNPNHIYAAPNKFYEAMFLGKPLFTTKGTIVEKKVLANKTGYVSEEGIGDIQDVLATITKENISEFGQNAQKLWADKFGTYTSDWLNKEYLKLMKSKLNQ